VSIQTTLALAGRWLRIAIDRPAQRNALDHAAWRRLGEIIEQREPGVRVLSIEGGEHFCAGADIRELRERIDDRRWMAQNHGTVQRAQQILHDLPLPTIAAVRGACYGGGVGLVTACDLRMADMSARFAVTPIRLGLLYSPPDTLRLVNAVGLTMASDLLLTARELDAPSALSAGLISRVCDADRLEAELVGLAEQLARGPRQAFAGIKRTLRAVSSTSVEPALHRLSLEAFDGPEFAAGAAAFANKETPHFG
jgi:enoyl-CoA hydratase/carnithine racemase